MIAIIDFLKLDDKFSNIVNLLLRRRACMSKFMKSCEKLGIYWPKVTNFAVTGLTSREGFAINCGT